MTHKSIEITCEVINQKGLHARAAAQIVTLSNHFDCDIEVEHKDKIAPSLSLIKLLTLDAPKGSIIKVKAHGQQAEQAIQALQQLIEQGFDE
ncbi:MAG: HPr family phosphocarrier protein [Enterobacterales bacterium]|nr:HPr family phosphocarrier protein [Enterobacterales bacterium]